MYHSNLKENMLLLLHINYKKTSLHDILPVENAVFQNQAFHRNVLF